MIERKLRNLAIELKLDPDNLNYTEKRYLVKIASSRIRFTKKEVRTLLNNI